MKGLGHSGKAEGGALHHDTGPPTSHTEELSSQPAQILPDNRSFILTNASVQICPLGFTISVSGDQALILKTE